MRKESMIGRRLYALVLDTILLFIICFICDSVATIPIMNSLTNIQEVSSIYEDNSKEYEKIQDEYKIYVYEDGKRVYNDNVSESVKKEFLNDSRILKLNEALLEGQQYILKNFIIRLCLTILLGSIIVYIIIPLILRNGRTIGKLFAKLYVINDNKSYCKWYKIILRYLVYIIFNVYLALISLGIIPLISLLIAINHKENKSITDIICKTLVVDGKIPLELREKKTQNVLE